MDRKIICNRKDDFKAYTAPNGIKQDGGCRRSDAIAPFARNIDGTTPVRQEDECTTYTYKPVAAEQVGPLINLFFVMWPSVRTLIFIREHDAKAYAATAGIKQGGRSSAETPDQTPAANPWAVSGEAELTDSGGSIEKRSDSRPQ